MRGKFVKSIIFLTAVFLFSTAAQAQDPLAVAPDMYKLLYENDRVRVMQVTFQPGQDIKEHSHPDHFVYVVSGGTLQISKPDGSSSDVAAKAGDVMWIDAESHWAKNIGDTEIKLVVSELREPKPKAAATQ